MTVYSDNGQVTAATRLRCRLRNPPSSAARRAALLSAATLRCDRAVVECLRAPSLMARSVGRDGLDQPIAGLERNALLQEHGPTLASLRNASVPSARTSTSPRVRTKPCSPAESPAEQRRRGSVPYARAQFRVPARFRYTGGKVPLMLSSGTGCGASPRYMSALAASGSLLTKVDEGVPAVGEMDDMNPPPPRLPQQGWVTASA